MTIEPSILLHVKGTFLGEGALWHAPSQVLYWVDISWPTVYRYDLKTGESKAYPMPSSVGAVVVRDSGGLIVALEDGFAHLDESTGNMTMLVPVEADMANTRFNDGKCDPAGRFLTPPPPQAPDPGPPGIKFPISLVNQKGRLEEKHGNSGEQGGFNTQLGSMRSAVERRGHGGRR